MNNTTRESPTNGSDLRVSSHEHEIHALLERFPKLTRTEVVDVIGRHGPMRTPVESELEKISAAKR
jgi:hypothetical protein